MGFSVIPEPAISGLTGPQGPAGTIPSDPVFTGSASVNDTTGDPNIDLKKNGSLRWKIRSAGTESGSNNGSDLWIESFADDGTTKIGDPIWISRTGTQVVIGQADSAQGGVKLSVNGAIGTRDLGADPATTSMGAQLYSKSGKLWVQTANGAEKFQVVESLPSKANATLSATYMNIDKAAGNYRAYRWLTAGVSRWEAQVDDVAETGSAVGSDFRLSARNDDGSFNKTVIHARRSDGTITFGTTVHHGTAQVTSAGALGLRDIAADPATTTGGVFLYSKGGLPYIQQADGTVFQVGAGGTSAVTSVNGKTGAVSLAASDVGAVPTSGGTIYSLSMDGGAGTYRALSWKSGGALRWATQVNDTAENGSDTGSNFELTAWGDDGSYKGTAIFAERATARVGIGTGSTLEPGATLTVGGATKINGKLTMVGDGTNNTVEWKNPSGSIIARIGGNGNLVAEGALYAKGGLQVGSTSTNFGGGAGAMLGLNNASTIPTSNPSAGVVTYSEGGVLKVRQSDGTIVAVQNAPSSFTPESLGVLAWAGDPGTLASGNDYSGVGQGRMTAVYINRTMSISKIVWHMQGYAGGLLTGSWAAIYDTAGTLKGATGDMSTAAYEPAEQHGVGGGWSSSNLTAPVTLAPGVYYVCWRFNYTASPVDGPALARWDSVNTTNGSMGLGTAVWRFAKFTSSATTAPSSITPSTLFTANGIQFWVALA
jgi:hypothetical protein